MTGRGQEILEAGISLALELGLHGVTRDGVAERARVSTALVNRYWGTIEKLRDKIVATAVERELLGILAQAILDKHPVAIASPRRLQERAARSLLHP